MSLPPAVLSSTNINTLRRDVSVKDALQSSNGNRVKRERMK